MKKIPCLFKRKFENGKAILLPEINPECEWVFHETPKIYEKLDGTACRISENNFYKRYDRKFNKKTNDFKEAPEGWVACEEIPDIITKHWPGWVPVDDSAADQWHREAYDRFFITTEGTYELVGPKINGNPYSLPMHHLVNHQAMILSDPFCISAEFFRDVVPESIYDFLKQVLGKRKIEGFIFRGKNGEMAKIRRKDFGFEWPSSNNKLARVAQLVRAEDS